MNDTKTDDTNIRQAVETVIRSTRPDTPRYYRLCPRFWIDERVLGWTDDQKLLALNILTSKHRNPEGIFILPLSYLAADMNWSKHKVKKAIDGLIKDCFIYFDPKTNVMLIRNAMKYQVPENPNQSKAVFRRVRDLPYTPLLKDFLDLAEIHCYRKGAGAAAQAFYQGLAQELTERLPERLPEQLPEQVAEVSSEPLTLSSSSKLNSSKLKTPNSKLQARNLKALSPDRETEKSLLREHAIETKWPHLRES